MTDNTNVDTTEELRRDFSVSLSETAYKELLKFATEHDRMNDFIRVYLIKNGLTIGLGSTLYEDDKVSYVQVSSGVVTVVCRPDIVELVDGVEIDYQTVEGETGFTVVNRYLQAPPVLHTDEGVI